MNISNTVSLYIYIFYIYTKALGDSVKLISQTTAKGRID